MRVSLAFLALSLALAACGDPKDTGTEETDHDTDADGDRYTAEEDCNDADATVNPGANEVCNGLDDNCDGAVDEGLLVEMYADVDQDGTGDANSVSQVCPGEDGWVEDNSDCDDTNAARYPRNPETCDGLDNDCDEVVDEEVTDTYYMDADGDGAGDASQTSESCGGVSGWVDNSRDCNDADATISPDAPELCNGVDDNCNGATDEEGAADAPTWYEDADKDGYGSASKSKVSCTAPANYVTDGTDCDDTVASINPGATEVCDRLDTDEDCDGLEEDADDSVDPATAFTWYTDADGDGVGNSMAPTWTSCEDMPGYTDEGGDCDDTDPAVGPGSVETCNGVDDDCDGLVDDSASDSTRYYPDADGDAWGWYGGAVDSCETLPGYVVTVGDCDDTDPDLNPDTGCASYGWDGTWKVTGELAVAVYSSGGGAPSRDTCVFSGVTAAVDEAGTPQISGRGKCAWEVIYWIFGEPEILIEGSIGTDGLTTDGSIVVGTFVDDLWTGSFSMDEVMTATGSGSAVWSGSPFDWELTMEFKR